MLNKGNSVMTKNILITVGGTGGHVFPAQALARLLYKTDPNINVLFVGSGLASNSFFSKSEFNYHEVSSGIISREKILQSIAGSAALTKGVFSSWRIMGNYKPDVIVGFGSYHSFPALLAAKIRGVPIILHEGNSIPGKVNRFFSKYARVTTVNFPQTAYHLRGKSLQVSFPLREGYSTSFASKEEARRHFVLHPNKFTFLVFGGSQGALSLNTHFCSAVMDLADRSNNFQILHLTGCDAVKEELQDFYRQIPVDACVKNFEERMDLAWQAADLVVARAGAATIAEQIAMETPGILIPYPYSSEGHQEKNADHMANEIKGALKLIESELMPTKLAQSISSLIENDHNRLNTMRSSLQEYKKQSHVRDLCSVVCEMAGVKLR
jgi:UDP-N-acetylglucosamine--N-acetylmuramyl-(pentapeptide) pyrophosphoryl-undecaprenol N-acetylglucosamine transferase